MAGVKEEHLEDQELSRKIFSVLEKAGSLENVRKQTRRMTTVDRPSTRARLRSLSSSSITPSKRQNGLQQDSPHAAKMLAHGSPLCYLPSLSKVPPPMGTPPPFSHFQSIRSLPPMPPYLNELSQSFSPAANFPLRPLSKKSASPPQPGFTKNSKEMPPPLLPVAKCVTSETSLLSPPGHHCRNSNAFSPPSSLPHFVGSLDKINCIADTFPPSIPLMEPLIKLGDVPSPLPQLDNQNSQTIPPCIFQESLIPVNIPPPPTPPFSIKQSSQNPLCSIISQIKETNNPVSVQDTKASIKEPEQQNNPLFLDQIKQGVQLKSVTQPSKVENAESLNIVTALMDVIKRRHKAIHSSDEDEVEDDEWED
ncbi:actin nucleation-promoting factor WASL-like [Ranitomeya imitator]|uniref:actin nucleation-promoting factor WASL-like n=1 Tax=Ranitomeya imitator TaxID=111125 RepID=UPI0037E7EE9F